MKRICLLFVIFSFPIYSDTESGNKSIKNVVIEYTIHHSFKKVKGVCNSPKLENLEIEFLKGEFSVVKPFTISCEFLNLKSGNSNRDSHMLEVLNYPQETLVKIQVEKVLKDSNKYFLESNIYLNQVNETKVIEGILEKGDNGKYSLSGKFSIYLSKFKIERPSLLFLPIQDEVWVQFQVFLN